MTYKFPPSRSYVNSIASPGHLIKRNALEIACAGMKMPACSAHISLILLIKALTINETKASDFLCSDSIDHSQILNYFTDISSTPFWVLVHVLIACSEVSHFRKKTLIERFPFCKCFNKMRYFQINFYFLFSLTFLVSCLILLLN